MGQSQAQPGPNNASALWRRLLWDLSAPPAIPRWGLDHILPPGLGKDVHIQRALAADNPFGMGQPADHDLQFAAEALACFGTQIAEWREIERKSLEDTLAALAPLRKALEPLRSPTALAVAPHRDVAGIAFFTAILRWPDRAQATGYLDGVQSRG